MCSRRCKPPLHSSKCRNEVFSAHQRMITSKEKKAKGSRKFSPIDSNILAFSYTSLPPFRKSLSRRYALRFEEAKFKERKEKNDAKDAMMMMMMYRSNATGSFRPSKIFCSLSLMWLCEFDKNEGRILRTVIRIFLESLRDITPTSGV